MVDRHAVGQARTDIGPVSWSRSRHPCRACSRGPERIVDRSEIDEAEMDDTELVVSDVDATDALEPAEEPLNAADVRRRRERPSAGSREQPGVGGRDAAVLHVRGHGSWSVGATAPFIQRALGGSPCAHPTRAKRADVPRRLKLSCRSLLSQASWHSRCRRAATRSVAGIYGCGSSIWIPSSSKQGDDHLSHQQRSCSCRTLPGTIERRRCHGLIVSARRRLV